MGRPFDRHIDNDELSALVPSPSESNSPGGGHGLRALSADAVREAGRHVASCAQCSRKVSAYWDLVNGSPSLVFSQGPRSADCPKDGDVDWQEVASGMWPEFKATQLIAHAALCDHCGPLLRAATSVDEPTPHEERLLAELKAPSRPHSTAAPERARWPFVRWSVPAAAVLLIAGVFAAMPGSSPALLSNANFAEFAVRTHKQHVQGTLALDVRSDSQQTLNDWLKEKSPFSLVLPASPEAPGEQRPTHPEGARLVQVGGKTAAYIAYQMPAASANLPVSLLVTPASVALASGGAEIDFKKVSFHYSMVEGYRVVTWSLHGLTYALVSQEGNNTQRSCMVCHSAMKDRDLSQTPTPLPAQPNAVDPFL